MESGLTPETVTLRGDAILPLLPELARLRIAVFREWPYLYDGDLGYEEAYLRAYAESEDAVVVVARAGGAVVGAASAVPLRDEPVSVQAAVSSVGWEVERAFYFGESVLLPAFRGRGLGHVFMRARLTEARAQAMTAAVFCAVRRDEADARRPAEARDLRPFWRSHGFSPLGTACSFRWREVGGTDLEHPMDFWGCRW